MTATAAWNFILLLLAKPLLIGLFAGVVFAAVPVIGRGAWLRKFVHATPIALAICIPVVLIAYVAGYLTGITGSSAVGNLVPAVLAFIGGFNVYLFGAKIADKSIPIYAIFLFAMILFYGVLDGLYQREAGINANFEARFTAAALREQRIRTLRKNLDLPEDPPAWALTSE